MEATILIVTYNYGHLIERAIKSIVDQVMNEADIEIVIVDDGSTDQTKELVDALDVSVPCRYYYQPNSGKAVATQLGIAMANGEIIFLLDADDWFLPGKIAASLSIYKHFPRVVHVASPALISWEDQSSPDKPEPIPPTLAGKEMDGIGLLHYFYRERMLFGGGSTFSARRTVLRQIPWVAGIDMYTDEWLIIQTLLQGNSYLLPVPYSVWQIHSRNYSNRSSADWQKKHGRLLTSSQAIFSRLAENKQTPVWLLNAYNLKHTMRTIESARLSGKAGFFFRWRKLLPLLFSGKYSIRQLWNYGTVKGLIH